MKDSQQQMEALTQQMNRLMQEKAELETRNRILEQVVRLNVEHVDQLQSNKVNNLTMQPKFLVMRIRILNVSFLQPLLQLICIHHRLIAT